MNLPKKRLRLQPSHFSVVTLIPQSSTKSGLNYNYYKLREAHFSTPIKALKQTEGHFLEAIYQASGPFLE